MDRRQLLTATATIASIGLAGCSDEPRLEESPTPTFTDEGTETPSETPMNGTETPDPREEQGSIPALRMPRFALRVNNKGEDDERVWVEGYLRNDRYETTEEIELHVVIYGRDDEELERHVESPPDGTLEEGEVWGFEIELESSRAEIGGWTAKTDYAGRDDEQPQ